MPLQPVKVKPAFARALIVTLCPERWHSHKAAHAQMPTAAESLQQCFRSADADQNSFFFELAINPRYSRKGSSKVTSYLSYRVKDLRLFLLVCQGDAARNLKQPPDLMLLCIESQPRWKRGKTADHFRSGHEGILFTILLLIFGTKFGKK